MKALKRATARYIRIAGVIALAGTGAALVVGSRHQTPREIRLVTRDMAFYIEGQDVPNPLLKVRAGEEVRVIVTNADAGMAHDFGVSAWNVRTPLLKSKGSEAAVVFRAPGTPGTQEYTCAPHAAVMRGSIEVE